MCFCLLVLALERELHTTKSGRDLYSPSSGVDRTECVQMYCTVDSGAHVVGREGGWIVVTLDGC